MLGDVGSLFINRDKAMLIMYSVALGLTKELGLFRFSSTKSSNLLMASTTSGYLRKVLLSNCHVSSACVV